MPVKRISVRIWHIHRGSESSLTTHPFRHGLLERPLPLRRPHLVVGHRANDLGHRLADQLVATRRGRLFQRGTRVGLVIWEMMQA